MMQAQTDLQIKAVAILEDEAKKIEQLIAVQLENLTLPKCPLYEEVLDTQMFGLSRQINLTVRLGLISRNQGQVIIHELERKLSDLYSRLIPSSVGE